MTLRAILADAEQTLAAAGVASPRFGKGYVLILIDRADHWQVGCFIPVGTYPKVREAALGVLQRATGPVAFPRATVERARMACECRPTATTSRPVDANGPLRLTARVAANGCNFLIIKKDGGPPTQAPEVPAGR